MDSGPLGRACQGQSNDESGSLQLWLIDEVTSGSIVVVPEIADYEVRRSLLKHEARASLARLDALQAYPGDYLPTTTAAIRRAAMMWAQARRRGESTAAESSIDGDVILAARVLEYRSDSDDWWLATGNERHLGRYLGDRARP